MPVTEIHYAYPTSEIGGKHGCYYTDNSKTGAIVKYDSEYVAVSNAIETGDKVIMCYGPAERANDYRKYGVSHAQDGLSNGRSW